MASDSKESNQSDTVRSKSLIRNCMSSMEELFPNSKGRILSILPIKKEVTEQRLYKESAGSQHRRSHPWQGHAERPDGQGESGLKGSSVWASTPKPKSVCLLSAILYSSDIKEGYPQPPFSGKS